MAGYGNHSFVLTRALAEDKSNKADDYSEENPLYIIKGMDKNGNEYEQTVDVSKVNPNNCSYKDILEFRKEENFKHKEQNIELNKKALALRAYNQQILEEH